MTLRDYMIEGTCDLASGSPSTKFTIVPSFKSAGHVEVKIYRFYLWRDIT